MASALSYKKEGRVIVFVSCFGVQVKDLASDKKHASLATIRLLNHNRGAAIRSKIETRN